MPPETDVHPCLRCFAEASSTDAASAECDTVSPTQFLASWRKLVKKGRICSTGGKAKPAKYTLDDVNEVREPPAGDEEYAGRRFLDAGRFFVVLRELPVASRMASTSALHLQFHRS